jgi:HEAT repeat protein
MSRLLPVSLSVFALLLGSLAPARGQEKEPELVGIKLSAWIATLEKDPDVVKRRRAVRAVGLIGELKSAKVVPALIKALRADKDAEVRLSAARGLGRNVSEAFAKAREDMSEDLPSYDSARNTLVEGLKADLDPGVREACAGALGDIGADARAAVRDLAGALQDKHAGTRAAAAGALRRMGPHAKPARKELQAALADKKGDEVLRTESARALLQLGADAAPALAVLEEALVDAKGPVGLRRAVAEGLARLGKDAGLLAEALGGVLEEKGPDGKDKARREAHQALRRAAVTTLDSLGADAKAAVPALVKALADEDLFVRCLAMHAIGQLGQHLQASREAAIKALVRGLKEPGVEVLVSSIEALGALGFEGLGSESESVGKALKALVARDGRKVVQEAAKTALGKIQAKKG